MLLTALAYVVATVVGATVVAPVAKRLATVTKTKKDDRVINKITTVLDQIPTTALVAYLTGKGVKIPKL